jgi:hypothetical protein
MPESEAEVALRPERVEELSQEIRTALSKDIGSLRNINKSTRLVSLNARIEAARAGESGMAFAAVAGEVMNLAQQMDASFHNLETGTAPLLGELEVIARGLASSVRGQRLSDLAATHLDLVDRNLYERSCDVRWWATEGAFVRALETGDPSDLELASRRMGKILDSYTVYFDLVLCDVSGHVRANGRLAEFRSAGSDVADSAWFRAALETTSGTEFGFEGVHASPLVGGRRALVYSAAVRRGGEERGEPVGVLGVVFRWDALGQTIVENAAIPPEDASRTRVLILDADGLVLAASDGHRDGERLPVGPWLASNLSPRFHLVVPLDGSPHLVALARSQGYETYATGWIGALLQELER